MLSVIKSVGQQGQANPSPLLRLKFVPLILAALQDEALKESEEFRDKIATMHRYNLQSATLNAEPLERTSAN